jgi:hypothetical protein
MRHRPGLVPGHRLPRGGRYMIQLFATMAFERVAIELGHRCHYFGSPFRPNFMLPLIFPRISGL